MNKKYYESILSHESSHGAESSYYFLLFYQKYKDWNAYDSDFYNLDWVEELTSTYSKLHGKVNISSKEDAVLSVFSPNPLGIFRYKMDENNYWKEIGFLNKISGYVVEGAYWNNGFFYRVLDQQQLLQIKLFVDDSTALAYSYPDKNITHS